MSTMIGREDFFVMSAWSIAMIRYLVDGEFFDGMDDRLAMIVRKLASSIGDYTVITRRDAAGFVEAYGSLIDVNSFKIEEEGECAAL